MLPGKLIIRPLGANSLRSVTKSGKMAPYIKICAGIHGGQSSAIKKTISNFAWEVDPKNEICLQCCDNEIITIECWHKKKLGKDLMVGRGVFTLNASANPTATMKTVPLTFEGLDAGSINIELSFFPENNTNLGNSTTATYKTINKPVIVEETRTYVQQPYMQNQGMNKF